MGESLDHWIVGYFPMPHVAKGKGEMGIPLHPLTFGHVCLLERMMCFPPNNVEDLLHCVQLCGRSYHDALEYFHNWKFKHIEDCETIAKEIAKDPEEWSDSFMRYYDANSVSLPLLQTPDDECKKGKKLGSPTLALMRHSLIARLGYNPQTLDEAPFSRCLLDLQSMMEMDGSVDVQGEDIDYAKKAIEDAMKKEEEKKGESD